MKELVKEERSPTRLIYVQASPVHIKAKYKFRVVDFEYESQALNHRKLLIDKYGLDNVHVYLQKVIL